MTDYEKVNIKKKRTVRSSLFNRRKIKCNNGVKRENPDNPSHYQVKDLKKLKSVGG